MALSTEEQVSFQPNDYQAVKCMLLYASEHTCNCMSLALMGVHICITYDCRCLLNDIRMWLVCCLHTVAKVSNLTS